MKVLHNKLIYDTEKLDMLFNLDVNKPKNEPQFTPESTYSTTPTGCTSPNGAYWVTTVSPTHQKSDDFTYTNYIASTPNHKYVIVTVKSVKNDRGEYVELGRNIKRFFTNADEIVELLSPKFGKDILFDTELTYFFEKIGIKLENA